MIKLYIIEFWITKNVIILNWLTSSLIGFYNESAQYFFGEVMY